MAKFWEILKRIISYVVKFIVKTGKAATQAVKYKLEELNYISKRREMILELGEKVCELNRQGMNLPEEVAQIVQQIAASDAELAQLRADHAAQKVAAAAQHAAEKAERAAAKAAEKSEAVIRESTAPVEVDLQEEASATAEFDGPIARTPDAPTMDFDAMANADLPNNASVEEVPVLKV